MRNLKRALSLALASVMLLGMMVVGSSAAFADADEIVNTEAVEIAAGLGLFAGSDGKFNPKGTVTRAQMAAVIAKMFYGSDLNADTYKGGNQFTDTASFEGGWAEGYINLGVEKGWFKGYGDGTFRPGNEVTTAEAMTMIVNLLGIDAGEGTWPMTVMAAAEENDLFDGELELKPQPATNVAMTRDQLAVVVVNGLYYSAEGVLGYTVGGKEFKDFADAVAYVQQFNAEVQNPADKLSVAGITELKADTLAAEVFDLQPVVKGYITANQATGAEATMIDGGMQFDLETGLDMLGHYVAVYYAERYSNEKNPGTAYAIVDLADYIVVDEAINGNKKDFVAAFGSTTITNSTEINFAGFDATAARNNNIAFDFEDITDGNNQDQVNAFSASAGTYAFDKENNEFIAYMAPIAPSVVVIGRISTIAGKETIRIGNTVKQNNEDLDEVVEYAGIAEDDIAIAKNYLGVLYLEKPEVVTGKITKTITKTVNGAQVDYTFVDGKEYAELTVTGAQGAGLAQNFTPNANNTYDFYLYNGKIIGAALASTTANLADAIYVVDNYTVDAAGTYGTSTRSYYAQGVKADGTETSILLSVSTLTKDQGGNEVETSINDNTDGDGAGYGVVKTLQPGFYTFEKSFDKEQAKKDVMVGTAAVNKNTFDAAAAGMYEYYQASKTLQANETLALDKDTKSLNIGGKAYTTADTKFVVIDSTTTKDELEVATYTGSMNKTLGENDVITVAVTKDVDGNYLVSMVVITTASTVLDAADFIYVLDANCSVVGTGKYEYEVYMTETNEVTTIIANSDQYTAKFYTGVADEDGVYTLNDATSDPKTFLDEKVLGVYGDTITTGSYNGVNATETQALTDIALAADVKIMDIRSEDVLEDTEVAKIETLKDIQSALKGDYLVNIDLLIDDSNSNEPVVTYIFVDSVKAPTYDNNDALTGWTNTEA